MARIIAGFATPHTPYLPMTVPKDPDSLDGRYFGVIREYLERARPDVIVAFDCDHLNTYFYDNLPAFAVAAVGSFRGPSDDNPAIAPREVRSHRALGRAIYAQGLQAGFDLALSERLEVDHSIMVPLHFLTPAYDVPLVPIFINGLAPPIPPGSRAHALGRAVGNVIRGFPEDLRVVVLATGSINHEVGGPRINEGELWGAPDPSWLEHVVRRLRDDEVETLVAEATLEKLATVGNVAGELHCIIAMLGAIGAGPPAFLEPQPRLGHAFGAWIRDNELEAL